MLFHLLISWLCLSQYKHGKKMNSLKEIISQHVRAKTSTVLKLYPAETYNVLERFHYATYTEVCAELQNTVHTSDKILKKDKCRACQAEVLYTCPCIFGLSWLLFIYCFQTKCIVTKMTLYLEKSYQAKSTPKISVIINMQKCHSLH